MASKIENGFKNPYDDAYYQDRFGMFETDGFQEWAQIQGFTLFNLDFLSLLLILLSIPLCAALYLLIHWFAAALPAAVAFAIRLHRRLRAQYGSGYLNVLMWKRGLTPFNGFVPFDPPASGSLMKLNLSYEYQAHDLVLDPGSAAPAPALESAPGAVHGKRS